MSPQNAALGMQEGNSRDQRGNADDDRNVLRTPEFCGACHRQFIPEAFNRLGLSLGQNQYDEWRKSHLQTDEPESDLSCRDCHMRLLYDSTDPGRGEDGDVRRSPAANAGAKVELLGGGERQVRWYGADVTFLGMHAADLVFGLGEETRVEELLVEWADGRRTRLQDVPAGRVEIKPEEPDEDSSLDTGDSPSESW